MDRLKGKVAVVTGAGRPGNIGRAICESFLMQGASVVATDIRNDDPDGFVERMQEAHGTDGFTFIEHDVTSLESWENAVRVVRQRHDACDVLVNNAGISVHGGIGDTSLEDLRKVMAVNHDGIFLGMKYFADLLEASASRFASGSVINNLSMSSYLPNMNNLAYTVSKAAARMLTVNAAVEFGSRRIRVNSVHPGLTLTPLIDEAFEDYARQGLWESREEAISGVASESPLDIVVGPSDLAHAFVYLASDESRYVTGAALPHDGGLGRRY